MPNNNYSRRDSAADLIGALKTNYKRLKRQHASAEALAFTARGIDGERDLQRLTLSDWPKDRELERLVERLRGPRASLAERIACGRELAALVGKLGDVIGGAVKRAFIKPESPNGLWDMATERGREIAREAIMGVGHDGKETKKKWDPTGARKLRSWVGLLVQQQAFSLARNEHRHAAKRAPVGALDTSEHRSPSASHLCERHEEEDLGHQFLQELKRCYGGKHAHLADSIDRDTTNAHRARTYARAANILKPFHPSAACA